MPYWWRYGSGSRVRRSAQVAGHDAGRRLTRRLPELQAKKSCVGIGAASKSFHVQANRYSVVMRLLCYFPRPALTE